MAQDKNNKYIKEKKDNKKERTYKNPANTKIGKLIIVVLALLMLFSGLISLIIIMATR